MIVLLLTTRNEAALLRSNIEHHLRWGVDHVCVAENASTDDTAGVLRSFGDEVSVVSFDDFGERQRVRTAMFRDLRARVGRIDWAGVSDTDEFWWAPGAASAKDLLATVPRDVSAATFGQKLFLPTELDARDGPAARRMLHRAAGPESPLFSGYTEGKTFYRGEALRRVSHEHRNPDVAAPEWRHATAAVHHYMIQDEDHFVMKVRRFPAWQPRARPTSRWLRALRPARVAPSAPALKADIKKRWWDVWKRGGESALREHYRTEFRVRRDDVGRHIASAALVRDTAFAEHFAAAESASAHATAGGPPKS